MTPIGIAKPIWVFDTEVYRDYFLFAALSADSGVVVTFDTFPGQAIDRKGLRQFLKENRLVSFNGIRFDMPIVALALQGADCAEMKASADKIIKNNIPHWQLGIDVPEVDHIDLIEVAPGIASLKIYGGRMHCERMQDLPIDEAASISPDQRIALRQYCGNDLQTTLQLYRTLAKQIELRERMSLEYGIDLRSKSDAQIAEAVIRQEVERRLGSRLDKLDPFRFAGQSFHYVAPEFVRSLAQGPAAEALQAAESAQFVVGGNGVVIMPKELADLRIAIGGSVYRMGIGGLHSSEKTATHIADADHVIIDRDVASYYPSIILNCGLSPSNMGRHFSEVYRGIVQRRLAAKRVGDKVVADALKITINGSFGKFGSPYSVLYAPRLLIQVTLTGQLALLALIEALESEGIPVVSANTDGVVIKCPRHLLPMCDLIVWQWEAVTGFETEATEYAALYSRDVNNYIAIKPDRSAKVKGAYAPSGLQKNPTNEVVTDAVLRYLAHGADVAETIRACRDIRRFVTIRQVKGGAVKGDRYLGRAVRWYYAKGETGAITYKINGYTVARSEGAKPLMDLPESFPADVDFDWYIAEAQSILADLGVTQGLTCPNKTIPKTPSASPTSGAPTASAQQTLLFDCAATSSA